MTPSKPRKQYTPEFKAQAIELLALGRPVAYHARTPASLTSASRLADPDLADPGLGGRLRVILRLARVRSAVRSSAHG